MSRHIDAGLLARYREGLGGRFRRARISRHLADCQRCAGASEELAAVTGLLARTVAPPMPEELTQRIQLAIAGEAAARSAARTAAEAPMATTGAGQAPEGAPALIPGRDDLPRRSRTWRPAGPPARRPGWPLVLRVATAMGAAAAIAGGGYLFASDHSSRNSASKATSSSERPAVAAPRPSAIANSNAAASASRPVPGQVGYRLAGRAATATVLVTGSDYTPKTLSAKVRRQLASAMGYSLPQPTFGPVEHLNGISVSHLAGCLTRISAGRKVLLADIARYAGGPAVIIVLRPAASAGFLDVAVVGLACSASSSDVIRTARVRAGPSGG